ncbi:MAG TPA: aminomethyl-transferring glycine dehydrogenase [Gemmatimonadaceae bacterium]|jgi:glycine dehydrogenase|nr:aminomethyl-transferring glycine dehydrogenase [Gemmatimonadaceae bacterium]
MTTTTPAPTRSALSDFDRFTGRHIGPRAAEIADMLQALGYDSLDAFTQAVVPASIRAATPLALPPERPEHEVLAELRAIAARNRISRSYIGMGYSDCITPPVIQRNVLENPGWYTAYTPYQAEIAQGRLEALLNFQTMVSDLTGLEIANASLLDEGTAAAEAMAMAHAVAGNHATKNVFFVAADCHPQTIEVVRTRARARGIVIEVGDVLEAEFGPELFGVLVQYPATDGGVHDYRGVCERAHAVGALVTAATDLLSLVLLTPPGEWGADVAVGSSQRFGVPLGFGGPHAAFFATRDEFKRQLPGRIIGVSRDVEGRPALRMALQTREQHIRREKATSNVCTAQVLLAVIASMYAVYHGPEGLRRIATHVRGLSGALAAGLKKLGLQVEHESYFDTLRVGTGLREAREVLELARGRGMNLRPLGPHTVGVALDETTTVADVAELLWVFNGGESTPFTVEQIATDPDEARGGQFARRSDFLTHPVFNSHHSETAMLRYLRTLEGRDLSLVHSMIPLGSCTMKLNATVEMIPITWPEFARLHPFAPAEQADGYHELFVRLERALAEITGFAGTSLQPNAGSQGEFAGLLVVRRYHESRGEGHRDVCLIPQSAHGTNPASAAMAGMRVVVVKTDDQGNIDVADLRARAEQHRDSLAALMVTYPSTHGVFETSIREVCEIVHANGGQVYMDGANMNAMVGLARPGDIGADVCHLNLHKTFCIPHGGGGPGMGPICVAAHLLPFLPGHPVVNVRHDDPMGPVSAAPWGSASILPISWVYIACMGGEGLTEATKVAILNANYMAHRLEEHYPVLYRGQNGLVAHECIIDPRALKASSGVEVEDIAKRLMDYGFHAPTVSFPVAGTLMIEPTESESKAELDRFCDALIAIREEIREVELGILDRQNNPLKRAPHTMQAVVSSDWDRPYSRERAAFPAPWTRERKFWPTVARVESAYGDRNLVCSCPPTDAYMESFAGI